MASKVFETSGYVAHELRGGLVQVQRKVDGGFIVLSGEAAQAFTTSFASYGKRETAQERFGDECQAWFVAYADAINYPKK